ncbi:MAG: aminopeptidase N [Actinomycetaceae bacterium]|nr:aminopeptidase N [Actinomycetaceae bacterium]
MPGQNLTRDEAEARSAIATVYNYDVELNLAEGEETFTSKSTVDFDAHEGASTFLDLIADEVYSIEVNGEQRDVSAFHDSRVHLDGLQERNRVTVIAKCRYMHTGEGLHRFTDPADGKSYCYSQFEVPDSRRVFAVFEQPDMKAQFTFHVITPADWVVFSNSPTPTPTDVDGLKRWDFTSTEQISSYITAIVAGPYVGKTGSLTSTDGREIPLGVYCRQSLEQYLDADWVMDVTRKGFAFFEKEYGRPYPFRKYDQIFVPEYNAGAMENAGCVTFRDQYIFRSKPTASELEGLANTILHELAHMWFGDLVTMRWWNDLWLNESFAEFMSHLCLAEGTEEWKSAWTGFMARKDWGMRQDQMPTTHPIVAPIRDLEDVEVNFDGITYAKGAAVLRQLVSYVGRDNFFKALGEYFAKHEWQNTTLPDLMNELEAASGRDLTAWSKVWLEEAGVTLLRPDFEVNEDGTLAELAVVQESFTPGSSLRPHRLAVAGYDLVGDKVERTFHEELDVDGARTVVESAAGIKRPALILVNDGDLAYAKIRMDEESLAFAIENIDKFPESLTRSIILASAWDMVRDAQMQAEAFANLVIAAIPTETDITMMELWLGQLDLAVSRYTSIEKRGELMEYVADRILLMLRAATAETDQQRVLAFAAARRATNAEQHAAIERLRTGEDTLMGLNLDFELKWEMLKASVAGGLAGEPEIEAMLREDSTMTGEQMATEVRASKADQAVKDAAFESLVFDPSLSNDVRVAVGRGYWTGSALKPEMYAGNVQKFFDSLLSIWEDNTSHTAQAIVILGFPRPLPGALADTDVVAVGKKWLQDHEDAPAGLVRLISEGVSEAERVIAIQALS